MVVARLVLCLALAVALTEAKAWWKDLETALEQREKRQGSISGTAIFYGNGNQGNENGNNRHRGTDVRGQAGTLGQVDSPLLAYACHVEDANQEEIWDTSCTGVKTCDLGPLTLHFGSDFIDAYFCSGTARPEVLKEACRILDGDNGDLVRPRPCPGTHTCSHGPLFTNFRGHEAEAHFCTFDYYGDGEDGSGDDYDYYDYDYTQPVHDNNDDDSHDDASDDDIDDDSDDGDDISCPDVKIVVETVVKQIAVDMDVCLMQDDQDRLVFTRHCAVGRTCGSSFRIWHVQHTRQFVYFCQTQTAAALPVEPLPTPDSQDYEESSSSSKSKSKSKKSKDRKGRSLSEVKGALNRAHKAKRPLIGSISHK